MPEDFAIMMPMITAANGPQYTLRAGVICSAIGWNLGTKLGLSLHDIHHTTGPVPHYATKMSFSMDRFFSRSLPPHKAIQRGSWTLEIGQPLFVLPEDHYETVKVQNPELKTEDVYLRVDWQTLRRLPISGAVLFNFRAVFYPMTDHREEPKIPALMVKILKEGDEAIMGYKKTWHVEHVVIPKLEEWAREQVESGMVQEGWEVGTLDEAPFFEGWEEVWRRRQGINH